MIPKSSGSPPFLEKKYPSILLPTAITKFSSLNEIILVLIPTTFGYLSGIEIVFPVPENLEYILFGIILVLLFITCLLRKKIEHEETIAEVLETGYFMNFVDRTASFISGRKDETKPILIHYSDGTSEPIDSDKINVKVILPESLDSLHNTMAVVDGLTKRGSLDNGTWILCGKEKQDGITTIYDYPRTMTAMGRYLQSITKDYNEQKSKPLHKHFNKMFKKEWDNSTEILHRNIFTIIEVPSDLKGEKLKSELTKPKENSL